MTVAGTATVVLTVAVGAYVASLGTPSGTGTRSEALTLTNVSPLTERSAPPAESPAAPASTPSPATPPKAGPSVGPAPADAPSAARSGHPAAPKPSVPVSAPESAPASAPHAEAPAPQKAVAPAEKPSGGGKVARYIDEVVALANAERGKAGCAPLRSDGKLRGSAQAHADDMADRAYYDHNTPEGKDAGDRITAAGYAWSSWGENIHRGPKTPAQAMEDWMNSDGHRRHILNCSFKDIGVGVTLTANGPWWVQNFGTRR
ncbi:CAP domain-containing protein [Streptomyces sp. NPDC048370]|uniref:CAP domain-containing protein n=1 Tax=Streptomyces sp. NPDC048370 TaxID=3365540 RepID=UPI003711A6CA